MRDRLRFLQPWRSLTPFLKYCAWGLAFVLLLGIGLGAWMDGLVSEDYYNSPPPLKGVALGLFSEESHYDYSQDLKELKNPGSIGPKVRLSGSPYEK